MTWSRIRCTWTASRTLTILANLWGGSRRTLRALTDWFESECYKVKSPAALAKLEDRFETLRVLHASGGRVEDAIKRLTTDADERAMQLSTIHKFKGLEAETVIYVNYGKEYVGLQENNLKYVGCTRAKVNLLLHKSD